jgi:hypothetical protein
MKQALVVGGQGSFVKEKLSKSLARHGIHVLAHWSWEKKRPPQVFPQGVDLVYICTDMVGHGLSEPCMNWARDNGLPYVNGTRKWAESIIRLTQGGFPLLDPVNNLPDLIEEIRRNRSSQSMEAGPTEIEIRALSAAMSGVVEQDDLPPGSYNAETGHVEVTMRANAASVTTSISLPAPTPDPESTETSMTTATATYHMHITNPKQREYMRALANNPEAENVDMWNTLSLMPLFQGAKFDNERAAVARKTMGITVTRKGGTRRSLVDIDIFNATLKQANITGYPEPKTDYGPAENPKLFPATASAPVGEAPPVVAPAPVPVIPPAPAAVAAFVPAPVPAPQGIRDPAEKWPNADFKDILGLLRDHMATYNIKSLTITESGVSFKRIEIIEGDLAI